MAVKRVLGRPKRYSKGRSNSVYFSETCQARITRFSEVLGLSNSGVIELVVEFANAHAVSVEAWHKNKKDKK